MTAPIIVSALFDAADQAEFDRLRTAHFPAHRNQLAAHLTLFHHLPPSVLPELTRRLATKTRGVPAPAATAARLLNLGRGVAIGIDSPALAGIRADLADAFTGLLTPQDAAGWRPHVTVQNKVLPADAKTTLTLIQSTFRPRPVQIAALAAWYYRGGPWERIATYKFG